MTAKIAIENVLQPGKTYTVDAAKFAAMRAAVLASLPDGAPGITAVELRQAIAAHLPDDLFPGGEKAGWWMKAAQLDLEAKGTVTRTASAPLRFHRV